jgi:transposase
VDGPARRPGYDIEHVSGSLPRRPDAKKKSFSASEQQRPDVQAKRRTFLAEVSKIDPDRLVFIDESGCNLAMTPSYGRAPAGQRVCDDKPANWGGNITVVGAIKNDRVLCHRTIKGAMNRVAFVAYVRELLAPRLYPGDVVVLDNLRPHHAPEVREVIEAAGALILYMPPYSPDLNPIELCWSFVKTWLRRLRQRTEQGLRAAIRNTFLRVRTDHLVSWFAHCGHGQRK